MKIIQEKPRKSLWREWGLFMVATIFLLSAIFVFSYIKFLPATAQTTATSITRGNTSHLFGGGNCQGCPGSGSFNSISWPHTLGSGADFLVVGIYIGGGPLNTNVINVSYGSQSMIRAVVSGPVYIYYLSNPNPGTNTVIVNLNNPVGEFGVVAQDYLGVNAENPIDIVGTNTTAGTSITVSAVTIKDKDWAFLFVRDDSGTQNPGTNSTTIFQSNNNSPLDMGFGAYDNQDHGDITPPGSWSMTVNRTRTSANMTAAMITFSPTPPPPPPITKTLNDLFDQLQSILNRLDVALSTRASELTLQGVKIGTDKLDVNLSTRASESTLADIKANTQKLIDGNNWQRAAKDGRAFTVTTNKVLISGKTETDFFLLKNAAGSGKNVRIKNLLSSSGFSEEAETTVRVYKNPTIILNGTPLTINNLKASGGASVATTAFRTPTISNYERGILIDTFQIASGSFVQDFDLALFLEPSENMLVTFEPSRKEISHALSVNFVEE